MRDDNKRVIKALIQRLRDNGIDYQTFDDLQLMCHAGFLEDTACKHEYRYYNDYVKEMALKEVVADKLHADLWRELYWRAVKVASFYFFEDYLLYMERKRPYERRFYEPRKKTQQVVVEDLQKLEDSDYLKMYTLSEPARIGKSGMILFFLSWVILRHPHSHNAMGTYSGPAAKHFYEEILKIFTDPEYCFEELYAFFQPNERGLTDKSGEMMSISFTGTESFPAICFRGIDGSWTGIVDISDDGYLAVDDLIRDREHALSQTRTDKTFFEYMNKMVDRKHEHAKELMIGTLWNVYDPIMRLAELHRDDDRYISRIIPALDENDESNFDYEYYGYSTQYYRQLRDDMIEGGMEADWMAKFQQRPYKREGILFPNDELRFFNGILPQDRNFELKVVCDTAMGGGDSVSMPIGLKDTTTNETYVVDWYFSSASVKVTIPGVVDMIIKHGVRKLVFEKNNGGQMYAQKVQEELEKRNYLCSCSTKPAPNNISKGDKIKACEGTVKSKIIFLDGTKHSPEDMGDMVYYNRGPMYNRALEELGMFATIGKNLRDDAADSIAQLCIETYDTLNPKVELIDRSVIGF